MNQEVCEKEVQEETTGEVVVKEVVEGEKFVQKIVARAAERGLNVVYEMTKKGFVLSLADMDTTVIKVKVIDLEQKLFKLKLISKLTFEHQKFIDLIAKCFGSEEPYVAEMKIKTECVFMKARDFAKMFKAMEKVMTTSGQYSFEERMGCGFGACMGCTIQTASGYKRVCKDGPVFFREEVFA